MHLAAAGRYGYQRDELYFIFCAQHLAWGYVDQPPAIAVVTKFAMLAFGSGLVGLRLLPMLASAATVFVTGRITWRLGGGVAAQALAMLAIALSPFYLAVGNLLTMNAFEPLLWLSAAYLFMKAEDENRPHLWLALGAVVGVGFLNKYSMFFYMASALVALAFTPHRRVFRYAGFWLAIACACALVAPSLAWQAAHGWPQVEVLRNAAALKNVTVGPPTFYLEQVLMMNPLSAPLWIAGLGFLLFARDGARMRWFGLTYFILSAVYLIFSAKVYYMAPIYPVLMAAGGVAAERFVRGRKLLLPYGCALALGGLAIAPQAFPLLPLETFLAYERIFDVRGIKMERHPEGRLPQHFADMLGWHSVVDALALAYGALPPAERGGAAILTRDYGQAAAVDFFGPDAGLPRAISGHNEYFLLGPRGYSGDVVLALGLDAQFLRTHWRSVERVGTLHDDFLLPDQNDLPIYKCTQQQGAFETWWPHTKRYV
ncbi:MAG: glycosyltransferase family 39 protein [Candidatus Eremiobacteraeota bacterium]|nr:glycosyltransferase family 39 protein [Candidatus Eremiobacteraeota bacterium]